MIQETLAWAAKAMDGKLIHAPNGDHFVGVCTDTRELKANELFFCLVGSRDGHDFAEQASQQAIGAIVMDSTHQKLANSLANSTPIILVSDTLVALGDLAHAWRQRFAIPVIAITGSNGKTTTKELIRSILSTQYKTLATQGNFNNLIGVPKTLFHLDETIEIAVIEMGMNDFGEIARLSKITEPTVALITNIAPAHLEKLKSIEGVARAKGELFASLKPEALAIINQKDPFIAKLPHKAKLFKIGLPDTKLWGKVIQSNKQVTTPLRLEIHYDSKTYLLNLQIPGEHNLDNILLALAVGSIFDVNMDKACSALENFTPAPSRMEIVQLNPQKHLIDDCYNANPASTVAAIKTLASLKGTQYALAILGDMNELGEHTTEGHRQIGQASAEAGIEYLITVGQYGLETLNGATKGGHPQRNQRWFKDVLAACENFKEFPKDVQWILVKGSRTNQLEKLVTLFKEQN